MRILKYLAALLFTLLLVDWCVNQVLEHLYAQTYTGQSGGKINFMLQQYDHLSTLAVGNSRCAFHIDPQEINEKTYNLSHNGMTLIYHVGLIDQLLRNEEIAIDTILLHLEREEIFGEKQNPEKDIQHLKYFYHKNNWIKQKIATLSRFEFVKYFFASFKWNGKVMSVVNNRIKSFLLDSPPSNGYTAKPASARDSINVSWDYQRLIKIQSDEIGEKLVPEFQENIEYLSALCKKKGIVLICFTSPIYKPVIKNAARSVAVEDYFQSINVPYLNYYDLYQKEKDLQSIWLWQDAYHMNGQGAKIFSKILRQQLNQFFALNNRL